MRYTMLVLVSGKRHVACRLDVQKRYVFATLKFEEVVP